MDNVAIYGFGGFGREIASIIQTINLVNPKWNIIGFLMMVLLPDPVIVMDKCLEVLKN